MNETWIGTIPFFGLIFVAIGCWFYMAGGRDGKWKRRFLGALIVSTAVWLEFFLMHRFIFWLLLIYPLTIASFSLGYTAEYIWYKIIRRSIVIAASLVSSIGICILFDSHAWLVLPIEIVIAAVSIYLGTINPIYASAEEFFICLFLWAPKLIYPFITL